MAPPDHSVIEDMAIETCDECVFDASRWTRQDAIRTVEHAADLVGFATEGLASELWNTRPEPDIWSIAEYTDHIRQVFEIHRIGCATALETPDLELPAIEPEPVSSKPAAHDPAALLAALDEQGNAVRDLFLGMHGEDWSKGLVVGGFRWSCHYSLTHLCHDLLHHLGDIASIRHALGDTIELHGTVSQINGSNGGVPKQPMLTGTVDPAGLEGDRQATRRHHGRPWQAVCLYSAEVIDAFAAEGHPIGYGTVGENLTLSGVDWSALRAGLTVSVGDVVLRLSSPAAPCSKTSYAFADRDHMRMDHERHPGWARWYASVVRGGTLEPGDLVRIGSTAAANETTTA